MKRANGSLASAGPFLLAPLAGWGEASALREGPPEWAEEVSVFQAGYGPATDRLSFCARHRLWYGGVLGCHVCRDFHVS